MSGDGEDLVSQRGGEGSKQKAVGTKQKAKGRKQKAESKRQKAKGRKQRRFLACLQLTAFCLLRSLLLPTASCSCLLVQLFTENHPIAVRRSHE
jgi:hypothetical protein